MSSGKKAKEDKDKPKEEVKGWRAIDLSIPPSGPLQRSITSMNGSEEPEWPLFENDDAGVDDEGDIESRQ